MALYTYDEQAAALYVLLSPEPDAEIARTIELGERLHVDLSPSGDLVGIEILYPTLSEVDLEPLKDRFGLEVQLPFSFAA